MKTVTLKVIAGNVSLQPPGVAPGIIRPGAYTVLVIDVPDDIPDAIVLNLYKQTGVWHTEESGYIIRYDQLGPGKLLVEKGELVGYTEAAEILGWDKRRVGTYLQRGSFPEPILRLAAGPIWTRKQIEEYRDSKQR